MRTPNQGRRGFTLIEVLVAVTLTLFLLLILAQAFVTGVNVFRDLKGLGDMGESLRTAANILRNDLSADHFEGKRRLSDPKGGLAAALTNTFADVPTREGFFRIPGGTSIPEGIDSDGLDSARANTHRLHFSVKLRGNRREDYFSFPPNQSPGGNPVYFPGDQPKDARYEDAANFNSQWAEIGYFLQATGSTVDMSNPGAGGTPLFALYRSQIAVVSDNRQVPSFNNPTDLTNPAKRKCTFTSAAPDATLLATAVISFQVQVMRFGQPAFTDINSFDTGGSPPSTDRIIAIRVILRVWDQKSGQARQVTVVQDM